MRSQHFGPVHRALELGDVGRIGNSEHRLTTVRKLEIEDVVHQAGFKARDAIGCLAKNQARDIVDIRAVGPFVFFPPDIVKPSDGSSKISKVTNRCVVQQTYDFASDIAYRTVVGFNDMV